MHFNDVGMVNHADYHELISQELLLFHIQLLFVNLLDGNFLAGHPVRAVQDISKLASSNSIACIVKWL